MKLQSSSISGLRLIDLIVGISAIVDDETRTGLEYMLRKVKKIWLNAQICQSRGCDETAWCIDVIQPLIKLAMRLEGEEKFWLQSMYLALHLVNGLPC